MKPKGSKQFYSIGEVASMFRVNTSALRYWEKEFKEISPDRDLRGNRIYQEKDIKIIRSIHTLLKEKKYKTKGAEKLLTEERKITDNKKLLLDKLHVIKEELQKLKKVTS